VVLRAKEEELKRGGSRERQQGSVIDVHSFECKLVTAKVGEEQQIGFCLEIQIRLRVSTRNIEECTLVFPFPLSQPQSTLLFRCP